MEMIYMLIIAAVAILLIHLLWIYMGWLYGSRKLPRVKFIEFLKLYKVNKNNWKLLDTSVVYNENAKFEYKYHTEEKYYELGFNVLDYFVYLIWHRYNNYAERKHENTMVYLDFRHSAAADFEKIEEDKK